MRLYLLICILFFCSCNGKDESKKTVLIDKLISYVPKNVGNLYYPLDSLFFVSDSDNRHGDSSIKARYSEILFNLQEPILYSCPEESIRFLWIRPFDNPIVVRLNNNNRDTIYANIKELKNVSNDADHYIPKIGLDTMIMLDLKRWDDIVFSLKTNNFWSASVPDTGSDYKDAVFWILECQLKNQYRFIKRSYLDTSSFKNFEYAKELYDIGNKIISMKNSREGSKP